jgi:hypothetical protein
MLLYVVLPADPAHTAAPVVSLEQALTWSPEGCGLLGPLPGRGCCCWWCCCCCCGCLLEACKPTLPKLPDLYMLLPLVPGMACFLGAEDATAAVSLLLCAPPLQSTQHRFWTYVCKCVPITQFTLPEISKLQT